MYAQTVYEGNLPAVMRAFAISLGVATIGVMLGVFVPPSLFLPLAIIEIGMLIFAFFLRRKKAISYLFLYTFTFISGLTMFPIINYYMMSIGPQIVLMALGTTTIVFAGIAIYASTTKRDFTFLGGLLGAALLALIVIAIFNLFWPMSSTAMLAYSFIGVLVFSGYVLFDFNRMKKYGVTAQEVPTMALNLYLDFINLFINILRIMGILKDRN
ncbi:Bax inhibitor-1/YccA family protein [Cytobacillus purgationiresistens]|uniref:FtsH-binding integral membrane protein n=1 Tax=Cytobacillus purgationiresistens TaxID=863449 RepID=A0ABU0AKG2_9BACI|nr:Bax inhibitor-1/YccA family protein [Cytobacillus purgationiresistens]MDQ0271530.1 FtsH-binding integral membrane protein [Cytobacillus purgationiresistens]